MAAYSGGKHAVAVVVAVAAVDEGEIQEEVEKAHPCECQNASTFSHSHQQ